MDAEKITQCDWSSGANPAVACSPLSHQLSHYQPDPTAAHYSSTPLLHCLIRLTLPGIDMSAALCARKVQALLIAGLTPD
jgi:hypothetical protein